MAILNTPNVWTGGLVHPGVWAFFMATLVASPMAGGRTVGKTPGVDSCIVLLCHGQTPFHGHGFLRVHDHPANPNQKYGLAITRAGSCLLEHTATNAQQKATSPKNGKDMYLDGSTPLRPV